LDGENVGTGRVVVTVVQYDPAAVASVDSSRVASVLAGYARRHEIALACTDRTPGDAARLVKALRRELPRFRFVSLLDPVDPRLLTDLVDEGVVPVAIGYDVAAEPLAAHVAAAVHAEALLRVADGPSLVLSC
jgi:acetylglutamate kinase